MYLFIRYKPHILKDKLDELGFDPVHQISTPHENVGELQNP